MINADEKNASLTENRDGLNSDVPVMKIFMNHGKFYLYDTYTNRLFEVTKDHYIELNKLYHLGLKRYLQIYNKSTVYNDIVTLIHKGMLKSNFVKKITHSETDYFESIIDRCISEITLQVTKDCNLKCRYCTFANDNKLTRNHSKTDMSLDIAKKSIDFLYDHSKDCQSVSVAFYGGEPTLKFELIKSVVEYAESKFFTKKIKYITTINGSILTDEMILFFQKYNFNLTISFDGSKDIQDFHRRYRNTGCGTFDKVYDNINNLMKNYPHYFDAHVSFIAVMFEDEDFLRVVDFFESIGIPQNKVHRSNADLHGIDYTYINFPSHIAAFESYDYIEYDNETNEFYSDEEKKYFIQQLADKTAIPEEWQHNGPCIPTLRRLFVSAEGDIYICEKITEIKNLSIGDIWNGIDFQKASRYLNIGTLSEKECKSCWAMRFCKICAAYCVDIEKNDLSYDTKSVSCNKVRDNILHFLYKCTENNHEK